MLVDAWIHRIFLILGQLSGPLCELCYACTSLSSVLEALHSGNRCEGLYFKFVDSRPKCTASKQTLEITGSAKHDEEAEDAQLIKA